MIDKNLAVIAMLSIVIALYAMKDNHTHWLPDLFGLALALTAPAQSMAILAVAILAVIRHSGLAYGLADYVPDWLLPLALPAARDMSITTYEAARLESAYRSRILEAETEGENTEESQPVAEIDEEILISAQVRLLGRAVSNGILSIGEATKLGSGAASGRKYQRWNRLIKAEVKRIENHYRALDHNRQQVPPGPD